eukprot:TRINITY_DN13862_c0_g3_i1.p1 TRINITY_DN13862_c0_g3~~TRINITY_DN13862_c0_g3_i1.p1  ORF type:complete len:186 (-),score=52.63 TRINITY_DN13862_c0_g3_i1:377-934(-)
MNKVNNKLRRRISFTLVEKLNTNQQLGKTRKMSLTATHVPFYNQDTGRTFGFTLVSAMVSSGKSVELIKPPEPKLKLADKSEILDEGMKLQLARELNPLHMMRKWHLLFSINTDGVSLRTFFNKVKNRNPTIMLVKDKSGCVFGAVLTEQWHPSSRFYGTGESFLFSFKVVWEVAVGRAEANCNV